MRALMMALVAAGLTGCLVDPDAVVDEAELRVTVTAPWGGLLGPVGGQPDLQTGGEVAADLGPLFFRPTLLADVPDSAAIMHEETFGTVAALTPFDDEAEVIARANASEYGLIAYVHSLDPRRIYRLTRALQYGMVAVNRTKVTGAPIPFGGMKQSGLGREGARQGLEAFTEIKYVCRDWA